MSQLMAPGTARSAALSGTQKAAIIVRLLLAEGAELPLAVLPERLQDELANQISSMGFVDRLTLKSVIDEFVAQLDSVGLSFPGDIEGTLQLLDGHISAGTAVRLRKQAGVDWLTDPWPRLADFGAETILPVIERESVHVGAIILSKLPVPKAAELLHMLPGATARRLTFEMSRTAGVRPDTVCKVGLAILADLDARPERAFDAGPVERVGAILNNAKSETRDDVLAGLDEVDRSFAAEVRRAIFTFDNIHKRLAARDVAKVVKEVDQPVLITALAGAMAAGRTAPCEHLLGNISQRMADTIRDEIESGAPPRADDTAEAMNAVVAAIRRLESEGQLYLLAEAEAEGETAPA